MDSLGNDEQGVQAKNVYLNELHPFKNHPFKVEKNLELYELMRSIEDNIHKKIEKQRKSKPKNEK